MLICDFVLKCSSYLTPAIVYNRTASPELVDESTGIVVNAGEIDTLVQAVNSLLDKGKDCFTEACRKRAEEQFDKKKSYSKFWQDLISAEDIHWL